MHTSMPARCLPVDIVGFALVLQASFNGRVARQFQSVMVAVVCSFLVGDTLMGIAAALMYAAKPHKATLMREGFPEASFLLYLAAFFGGCLVLSVCVCVCVCVFACVCVRVCMSL